MNNERALLNAPDAASRLDALKLLLSREKEPPAVKPAFANNHIHTTFSFSPYSPTAAVWFARAAGLPAAGIMDHDSIGGAAEFREAARLTGLGATCGFEMRVTLNGTPWEGKRLNSPDQPGMAYLTFHSVKPEYFAAAEARLAPLRELRNLRNRRMTEAVAAQTGIPLDFERDVLPLSQYQNGGAVTERHILFALTGKLLSEGGDERYALLGKLKKDLLPQIYIPAKEELMTLADAVSFAKEIDAVLCYAYLGDVTNSPTGDKAAATYEDGYLDELLSFMAEAGVSGVTFMPSRNTLVQLERVMALCRQHNLCQISGEDVNSLGQSFICEQLQKPQFHHLIDATWALVERERK